MFKPKTFSELCQAMQTRATVQIHNNVGIINGINAEDGSGRCWIVLLLNATNSGTDRLFFREE